MSYDIHLNCPVSCERLQADFKHDMRGGTYCVGGTSELWVNITWNYSKFYYKVFGEAGIRTIYGKTGLESIPILENAIKQLGDEVHPDYWEATEGNAKKPLLQLVAFAKLRPDGVWGGD